MTAANQLNPNTRKILSSSVKTMKCQGKVSYLYLIINLVIIIVIGLEISIKFNNLTANKKVLIFMGKVQVWHFFVCASVDNVLSNTLPLSEPMLAGITQHWGRFNEYILFYICFMFFLVYLCIYNYDLLPLGKSDLLDLITFWFIYVHLCLKHYLSRAIWSSVVKLLIVIVVTLLPNLLTIKLQCFTFLVSLLFYK
jgi:hypothetical protein